MSTLELSEGNSSYVQITLTNPIDGGFINDATVTGEILNPDDTEAVASFSIPYVAASDGIYRATIAPSADIVNGKTYKVIINSSTPDSLVGYWECCVEATKASGC